MSSSTLKHPLLPSLVIHDASIPADRQQCLLKASSKAKEAAAKPQPPPASSAQLYSQETAIEEENHIMDEGDREGSDPPKLTQAELNALASSLDIQYAVLDNLSEGQDTYRAMLTLCNNGETEMRYCNWTIFFSHIRMIEPKHLPNAAGVMISKGLHLMHVDGRLFRLQPTKVFSPLRPGQVLTIPLKGRHYSVARSDILPNWYLASDGLEPRVIASTAGESLSFVAPFDTPSKWKRFDFILSTNNKQRYDVYDPFTAQVRFEKNMAEGCVKLTERTIAVVPTPVEVSVDDTVQQLAFSGAEWSVQYDPSFKQEAEYLADKIHTIKCCPSPVTEPLPCKKSVVLSKRTVDVSAGSKHCCSNESYLLSVDPTWEIVTIEASEKPGVFYGIQTLLSLLAGEAASASLPKVVIKDTPRYPYRGMHLDVSRNFHGKGSVLRLLEVMAMYKMNKFHFHLTDDEGWRLQIPGLEELTEVGSKRGHTTDQGKNLPPFLGSGPYTTSSGSGFFSVGEYQEILSFATQRHIEVIPEIDMPGHCYAAVQAMKVHPIPS